MKGGQVIGRCFLVGGIILSGRSKLRGRKECPRTLKDLFLILHRIEIYKLMLWYLSIQTTTLCTLLYKQFVKHKIRQAFTTNNIWYSTYKKCPIIVNFHHYPVPHLALLTANTILIVVGHINGLFISQRKCVEWMVESRNIHCWVQNRRHMLT